MAIASTGSAGSASIRKPHVAGAFYPAEMEACRDLVRGFLDKAAPSPIPRPKVIVAPHAGFIFSGPIAGSAYANLAERAEVITRVVLIGPAHRVAFKELRSPAPTITKRHSAPSPSTGMECARPSPCRAFRSPTRCSRTSIPWKFTCRSSR